MTSICKFIIKLCYHHHLIIYNHCLPTIYLSGLERACVKPTLIPKKKDVSGIELLVQFIIFSNIFTKFK